MRGIVLLGAPGAGKGTISQCVLANSNLTHLSTGDILRHGVKTGSKFGRAAEGYMKQGQLVPDDIILELVESELDDVSRDTTFLFDGFPRTPPQVKGLDAAMDHHGGSVTHVFYLDTPREILISRLSGRRLCKQCGAGYHLTNIPPKKPGICDACGGQLYQRPDDSEETIIKRLDVYKAQTESLIAIYDLRGLLLRINSNQDPGKAANEILTMMAS